MRVCTPNAERACDELTGILGVMNAFADADYDKIVSTHAELSAQVLHRMPPIIPHQPKIAEPPRSHGGQRPRAMRQKSDPHPEGWGHDQQPRGDLW